jgi:hypothetical protein
VGGGVGGGHRDERQSVPFEKLGRAGDISRWRRKTREPVMSDLRPGALGQGLG